MTHRAFGRILVCTLAYEAESTFGCGCSCVQTAMLRFISTHTDTRRSGAGTDEAVQKCVHISWCSADIVSVRMHRNKLGCSEPIETLPTRAALSSIHIVALGQGFLSLYLQSERIRSVVV